MCAVTEPAVAERIGALILAAGASRRLGRAKQTVMLGSEMLLARAVRGAREARLDPVLVVVSPAADFVSDLEELGCVVVTNNEAAEGMASSIRCGIAAAQGLDLPGVVVMTCDQPGVRPEHLLALAADGVVTGSAYAGRVGVPAYFPAQAFGALLALRGDAGARELLRDACAITDEALELDIDTEDDLRRAAQGA